MDYSEQIKKEDEILFQNQNSFFHNKKLILYLVIMFVAIIIIGYMIFSYIQFNSDPIKKIGIGANILSAELNEEEDKIYVALEGGTKENEIDLIGFTFRDSEGKDYFYSTDKGAKEISLDYEVSFIRRVFGKDRFRGTYDYVISPEDLNLPSLKNIKSVSVEFFYKTKDDEEVKVTPPLDTKPVTPSTSTGGGGGGSGGGGGGSGGGGGGSSPSPSPTTPTPDPDPEPPEQEETLEYDYLNFVSDNKQYFEIKNNLFFVLDILGSVTDSFGFYISSQEEPSIYVANSTVKTNNPDYNLFLKMYEPSVSDINLEYVNQSIWNISMILSYSTDMLFYSVFNLSSSSTGLRSQYFLAGDYCHGVHVIDNSSVVVMCIQENTNSLSYNLASGNNIKNYITRVTPNSIYSVENNGSSDNYVSSEKGILSFTSQSGNVNVTFIEESSPITGGVIGVIKKDISRILNWFKRFF